MATRLWRVLRHLQETKHYFQSAKIPVQPVCKVHKSDPSLQSTRVSLQRTQVVCKVSRRGRSHPSEAPEQINNIWDALRPTAIRTTYPCKINQNTGGRMNRNKAEPRANGFTETSRRDGSTNKQINIHLRKISRNTRHKQIINIVHLIM